jgi:hypothetical protein
MRLFASKALWYVALNIKIAMFPGSMQMACVLFYIQKGRTSLALLILVLKQRWKEKLYIGSYGSSLRKCESSFIIIFQNII